MIAARAAPGFSAGGSDACATRLVDAPPYAHCLAANWQPGLIPTPACAMLMTSCQHSTLCSCCLSWSDPSRGAAGWSDLWSSWQL